MEGNNGTAWKDFIATYIMWIDWIEYDAVVN